MPHLPSDKPKNVLYAELALWAWTVWMCVCGIYQAWVSIGDLEKMIAEQLQGMIEVDPESLMWTAVIGYAMLGAGSAWIVLKIGEGKNWARISVVLSFALDAIWTAMPPYRETLYYLLAVPDIGLQIYALYLLYTWPGRAWFDKEQWV
ncbi:MAG: hypothetical protein WDO70_08050 [Alphaproteobacteria bacterium]